MNVRIQVIKVYDVEIDTDDSEEAILKAYEMQTTEIEATGIPPTDDAESAIVLPLGPGAYTAIEAGKNGMTGVGLVEVYNLH